MKHKKISRVSLAIVFVTDPVIKSLNKKFLKRSAVTDVLAFDLTQNEQSYRTPIGKIQEVDGEIYISTDTALKNSGRYQTSVDYELSLYVVHGILHLLGYDDHRSKEKQLMRREEKKLMKLGDSALRALSPH